MTKPYSCFKSHCSECTAWQEWPTSGSSFSYKPPYSCQNCHSLIIDGFCSLALSFTRSHRPDVPASVFSSLWPFFSLSSLFELSSVSVSCGVASGGHPSVEPSECAESWEKSTCCTRVTFITFSSVFSFIWQIITLITAVQETGTVQFKRSFLVSHALDSRV